MIKMLALICIAGGPSGACTFERAISIVAGPSYESASQCAQDSRAFERDPEVRYNAGRNGQAVLRLLKVPADDARFSINIICRSRAIA